MSPILILHIFFFFCKTIYSRYLNKFELHTPFKYVCIALCVNKSHKNILNCALKVTFNITTLAQKMTKVNAREDLKNKFVQSFNKLQW